MGIKKKERRKINAMMSKVFELNKKEIEEKLECDGAVELIIDLGNGRKISLGVLEK